MTVEEAYELGRQQGKREVMDAMLNLFGLREYIAQQIESHELARHKDYFMATQAKAAQVLHVDERP